jgi:hypothetical protein
MRLENFQKMKDLFESAKLFGDSLIEHTKTIKNSNGNVDKHAFKFCKGSSDRFNAATFKFYLEAYRGNYGSSSCCSNTVYRCSNEELNEAVTRYLNKNKQQFLSGVADELKLMAQTAMIEAEKEVAAMQEALITVKSVSEQKENTND